MSLMCFECRDSMGPSYELPGRNGVLVHPILRASAYVPSKSSEGEIVGVSEDPVIQLEAPHNLALCYPCIEGALPANSKGLSRVYEILRAEWSYANLADFHLDLRSPVNTKRHEAFENSKGAARNLGDTCLLEGHNSKEKTPHFIARSLDTTKSKINLIGNYSLFGIETGMTAFRICGEDFMRLWPRSFEHLSYDLRGMRNPDVNVVSEINISPEFAEAFEKETREKLAEHMRKEKGKLGNTIISIGKKKDDTTT